MRRFFEPADGPSWLKSVLSSIRAGLGDIWDVPVRLAQFITADRPPAADYKSGLIYDTTDNRPAYSDGSIWTELMPYTAGAALTRTNDTNVTLTLGGTPATALLAATSLTLGWTGTLAVGRGGTGVAALGDITRVNDTNVTLTLGGTPTGAVITSTTFTLGWTGTLAVARGGTGGGSASGTLLDNITGFASTGHLVRTGSGTYAFRTVTGTANQITVTNGDGVSANPTLSLPSAITTPGTLVATGLLTGSAGFKVTGSAAVPAGSALHVDYDSGTGAVIAAKNFTGPAYLPLTVQAESYAFKYQSTTVLALASTGATVTGTLAISGNATLGDATTDSHTVNGLVTTTAGIKDTGSVISRFENTGATRPAGSNGSGIEITAGLIQAVTVTAGTPALANMSFDSTGLTFKVNSASIATVTSSAINLASGKALQVNGTQVIGARITGWTAATNTKSKATFDTTTVTTAQLAARVGQLIDDLMTHGVIGA